MTKKNILVIIFVISTVMKLFAQSTQPLHMVNLPDSVRLNLSNLLKIKEKLPGADYPMYVFNLINPKDYKYKDGIYTFRLMGPHYNRRIFIVNKLQVHIFDDYDFDNLLQEYVEFIKTTQLTPIQKILYLKAISRFLEEEFDSETSLNSVPASGLQHGITEQLSKYKIASLLFVQCNGS